jgi:hypothetical protein
MTLIRVFIIRDVTLFDEKAHLLTTLKKGWAKQQARYLKFMESNPMEGSAAPIWHKNLRADATQTMLYDIKIEAPTYSFIIKS